MIALRFAILSLIALILAGCQSGPQFALSRSATSVDRASTPSGASADTEYRLGAGDVISVRVYGGEEETRIERVRLSDAGTITLPFAQYKAVGRTTTELEAEITQTVKGRILVNPRVWVNIDEYRPFFVEGQVGRPGAYPYQPGLNIRKAISVAGGFGPRASMNRIFIVHENDKSNMPVKVDLNGRVGPGDTVSVQESFF